jgi:hypothetical protein
MDLSGGRAQGAAAAKLRTVTVVLTLPALTCRSSVLPISRCAVTRPAIRASCSILGGEWRQKRDASERWLREHQYRFVRTAEKGRFTPGNGYAFVR